VKLFRGFQFNGRAFAVAVILFVLLALLATVGRHTGFLRSFGGDVLAVVWLYYVFRAVLKGPPVPLAVAAFLVGCALEVEQYVMARMHWRIPYRWLRIVLGTTADWMDVLAYAVGLGIVLCVIWLERAWRKSRSSSPIAPIAPGRAGPTALPE
jgi:hypothetical protein